MAEYFGLERKVDSQYLDFGEWGDLSYTEVFDLFAEAHSYFDSDESKKRKTERTDYIKTCKRWYEGYHPKPLKIEPGDYDDNVLVNYCRPLVDDGVAWLWGRRETGVVGIRPIINGVEEGENVSLGMSLASILKNSGGFNMLKKWGLRGSIAGHSFLKITLTPDTPIDELTSQDVKIVVLDPSLMDLQVDPADEDVIIAYSMEWAKREKGEGGMQDYIYRQLVIDIGGAWAIADFRCKDRAKREWVLLGGPWAWPWTWSPIVSGPNIEAPWGAFGYSDLEDITGLNAGINTAISNYGKILRHHAHPKTIGTGFEADEIKATEIGSLWTVRNPEAMIKNLEMQTDLRSSLAFINTLTGSFWNIGRGLDPTVYQQNVANVTNFGLRVMSLRSLEKMEDKRGTYGKMLREVITHSLDAIGVQVDDVKIEWPDPLPNNPTAVVDKLEKEIGMGVVSRETASSDLGRTWRLERDRIMNEAVDMQSLGEVFMRAFDRGETGGIDGRNEARYSS